MDALGITINSLSPQKNHPISPTVPFPSNQYGEAGSRRDDIDRPQFLSHRAVQRHAGGSLLSYTAIPCLSPHWAAGKMGTERLRSEQSYTASWETGPLCSYYHPLSSTSLKNMSAVLYVLQTEVRKELTDTF